MLRRRAAGAPCRRCGRRRRGAAPRGPCRAARIVARCTPRSGSAVPARTSLRRQPRLPGAGRAARRARYRAHAHGHLGRSGGDATGCPRAVAGTRGPTSGGGEPAAGLAGEVGGVGGGGGGEGESLRQLSRTMWRLCRGEDAMQAAVDAVAVLRELPPSSELGWALATLAGWVWNRADDPGAALNEAIALAMELGDKVLLASC